MNILIIAPHCSTGGMPAYTAAYMKAMREAGHRLHFAEFKNYSDEYTVQRDYIRREFDWSCHAGDEDSLLRLIEEKAPDVVHWQEEMTSFLSPMTVSRILKKRNQWRMVLTSHERYLKYDELPYVADRYVAVCRWQREVIHREIPMADVGMWEFPVVDNKPSPLRKKKLRKRLGLDLEKKHLVQVGLWSAHKRQDWTICAANYLGPEWHVHFIGNLAPNMRAYWEGLLLPENATAWGERRDVEDFLQAADAFILPSTKELAPISLREALSAGLACYVSPLEVYVGMDEEHGVRFLDMDRPESLGDMLYD